jgi:hypothetical protein
MACRENTIFFRAAPARILSKWAATALLRCPADAPGRQALLGQFCQQCRTGRQDSVIEM